MARRRDQRIVLFDVVDGRLVRTVTLPDGRTYTHRCTRRIFEDVAYKIEEWRERGATMEELAEALEVPYTQVNVALEFMKERGCVETPSGGGRRSYPASKAMFEDAMTEFCYLAEAPY